MAFQRGEFFSYGMQLAKVCVTVVCILVAVRLVLVVPRSPSFYSSPEWTNGTLEYTWF